MTDPRGITVLRTVAVERSGGRSWWRWPSWGWLGSSAVGAGPPSGRRAWPARLPWASAGLVAALLAASLAPGGGEALQYDRARVAAGEPWRLLTGQAVHLLSTDLQFYRGSSGLSSGLFVLSALCLAGRSPGAGRALAVAALALFAGKAGWEALASQPLFAGPLPPGIRVVPLVHLLGGLGGLLAWLAYRRTARVPGPRAY